MSGRVGPRAKQRVLLQRRVDSGFQTLRSKYTTRKGRFAFSTSLPFGATAARYRVLSPKQSGRSKAYVTPARKVTITQPIPPTPPDVVGTRQLVTSGEGASGATAAGISEDGGTVVFETGDALLPSHQGGLPAYYAWDRVSGTIRHSPVGGDAGADLSADGTEIVVSSDGLGTHIWEPASGTTIEVMSGGGDPSISADGDTVALWELDYGSSPLTQQIWLWTRGAGEPIPITSGSLASSMPSVSGDGSIVAFESSAPDLTPEDPNGYESDVFVWQGGTVRRVPFAAGSAGAAISSDGEWVAFSSVWTPETPSDIYLWNLTTDDVTRITEGNAISGQAALTADGTGVTFSSLASNLVPGEQPDTNGAHDLFTYNRVTGTTTRLTYGPFDGSSGGPSVSGDGRFVSFSTAVPFDPRDTNGLSDPYLWDALG